MKYSDDEVEKLIEYMEAALKQEHERVQEMYRKAGGIFSWIGPEWPLRARMLIKKMKDGNDKGL